MDHTAKVSHQIRADHRSLLWTYSEIETYVDISCLWDLNPQFRVR